MVNAHGLFLWAALAPKTSAEQAGTLYEGTTMPPSVPPRTASW